MVLQIKNGNRQGRRRKVQEYEKEGGDVPHRSQTGLVFPKYRMIWRNLQAFHIGIGTSPLFSIHTLCSCFVKTCLASET